MQPVLLIDNYDSFVYNLARYVGELGYEYVVHRNDKINITDIKKINPSHIILSPGPCTPDQAGICQAAVTQFADRIPILGVCLGHQVIGQAYGGKIVRAHQPMHGKSHPIKHQGRGLFNKLQNPLIAARYHSLVVSVNHFPAELTITAISDTNEIMALQHKTLPVFGVQFHPESVLTQQGYQLLQNFLA